MERGHFNESHFDIKPRNDLLAKCKKCGNKAPAKDFKIDDDLGVMVCSNCFQSTSFKKVKKEIKTVEEKEVIKEKPRSMVIYDEEDVFRENRKERVVKSKVQDDRLKFICDKCGFGFKYNPIKMWPRGCPACGRKIRDIKEGSSIMKL